MTDELLEFARGLTEDANRRDEQLDEAREMLRSMTLDEQIDFLVYAIRSMDDDSLRQCIKGVLELMAKKGA